ncbi:MAG: GNAT family N-acetyltransferase [Chloroflexota bacterium]
MRCPAARGGGVGRALFATVERRARNRGCVRIDLDVSASNIRALALYRNLDLVETGRCLWSKPLAIGGDHRQS